MFDAYFFNLKIIRQLIVFLLFKTFVVYLYWYHIKIWQYPFVTTSFILSQPAFVLCVHFRILCIIINITILNYFSITIFSCYELVLCVGGGSLSLAEYRSIPYSAMLYNQYYQVEYHYIREYTSRCNKRNNGADMMKGTFSELQKGKLPLCWYTAHK